jgi:hypothetical protein
LSFVHFTGFHHDIFIYMHNTLIRFSTLHYPLMSSFCLPIVLTLHKEKIVSFYFHVVFLKLQILHLRESM